MRILSFSLKIMLLAIAPMVMFSSCDDDDPEPETATIHGTITMDSNQVWAAWKDTGEVQLTIFPEFVDAAPPAGKGWGPISPNVLYPGFPGGTFALSAPVGIQVLTYVPGQTEYHYELEVAPGTYSALAVGFRHNAVSDPNTKTATLGVHWNTPDTTSHGIRLYVPIGGQNVLVFNYPAPTPITVEKGDNVEINFRADFSFVNQWYQ